MTSARLYSPIPCDPDDIPRLRVGRKVMRHVYLQRGPAPSDDDEPLFTAPTDELAVMLVAGLDALRTLNTHGVYVDATRAGPE